MENALEHMEVGLQMPQQIMTKRMSGIFLISTTGRERTIPIDFAPSFQVCFKINRTLLSVTK